MPLRIGDAPLRVVATRDLGQLGPGETQPVMVAWRWYFHVPEFVIWILVAALLVFVKENRNWQAWKILLPAILLTTVVWPLIVRSMPSAVFSLFCFTSYELADFAFNWLIGGWTAVWLVAPWLARRRPAVVFSLVLAFLLLSGAVAHAVAFSGVRPHFPSTTVWYSWLFVAILWYGTCAVAMLLGMTLGAIRCRSMYRPQRLLVGMAFGVFSGALVGAAAYVCRHLSGPVPLTILFAHGAVVSLGIAAFTYSVSLPFLYLAHRCPCYRDRLHKVLRLPDTT